MASATTHALTSRELSDVVDLLTASSTTEQQHFVLSKPREAVRQSQTDYVHQWDPRMNAAGNRIAKRLALLLDCLAKMNSWLKYKGRAELQAIDRDPLTTGFVKLEQESKLVAEAVADHTGSSGVDRNFLANTQRNIYRCFKCNQSGNAIDLWSHYRRLPIYEAAQELEALLRRNNQPPKRP
jgi:hypothetical protein